MQILVLNMVIHNKQKNHENVIYVALTMVTLADVIALKRTCFHYSLIKPQKLRNLYNIFSGPYGGRGGGEMNQKPEISARHL